MTLIRRWDIPKTRTNEHLGPCEGGVFFAHRDYNDVVSYWAEEVSFADLSHLLKLGRVWIQDAERPDLHPWEEIKSLNDLPKFKRIDCSSYDSVGVGALPYMPEFYFAPNGAKGKRFLKRLRNRTKEL